MTDLHPARVLPLRNESVRRTLSVASAAIGLVLSLAAGAFLIFWPCVYVGMKGTPRGSGSGGEPGTAFCSGSLLEGNGSWVLFLLAIPVAVALGGLVAAMGDRRAIIWIFAVTLVVCVFLGAFSIGIYYVPSALALIVAALLCHSTRRDPAIFPA